MLTKDISLEQLALEAGRASLHESKDSADKAIDKLYEAAKKAGKLEDVDFKIRLGAVLGFYKGMFGRDYEPPTVIEVPQ